MEKPARRNLFDDDSDEGDAYDPTQASAQQPEASQQPVTAEAEPVEQEYVPQEEEYVPQTDYAQQE